MISKTNRNRTALLNALRALSATLPSFVLALASGGCGERYQLGEVAQELDQSEMGSAGFYAPVIADGREDADALISNLSGPAVGDVDGDGFDDWMVFAHLAYGGPRPANGIITVPENVGPKFALSDGNEQLSTDITSHADIDGDGHSDLLFETSVGMYHGYSFEGGEFTAEIAESEATIARRWATQRAFLWYGSMDRSAAELELGDAAVSFDDPDDLVSRFTAELTERQHPEDAYFDALQNLRLTALGDVDADGYDDFALSSTFSWRSYREEPRSDGIYSILTGQRSESVTYVYFGKSPRFAPGVTPEPDARFDGISLLISAGDVNGDGYADVQARTNSGEVRLLPGGGQRLSGDIDLGIAAVEVANAPPLGLTALGDMDEDGFDDFAAMWAWQDNVTDYAIVYGSSALLDGVIEDTAASAIVSVPGPVSYITNVGDWNGDGGSDLLLGLGRALTTDLLEGYRWSGFELRLVPGAAERYSGRHEISVYRPGVDATYPIMSGGQFAGDIDGDGFDDLFLRSSASPTERDSFVKYGGPLVEESPIH